MKIHIVYTLVVLAIGFGLGRTKHFENLVAAVKAVVAKIKSKV